jgi:hypothetical protein
MRSAIVHGTGRIRSEGGKREQHGELRKRLEDAMRAALLKSISSLAANPESLQWSALLDRVLDEAIGHNPSP